MKGLDEILRKAEGEVSLFKLKRLTEIAISKAQEWGDLLMRERDTYKRALHERTIRSDGETDREV